MCPQEESQSDISTLLQDKLQFLQVCITEIEAFMQDREISKQVFIQEIDREICDIRAGIYELDNLRDGSSTSRIPDPRLP